MSILFILIIVILLLFLMCKGLYSSKTYKTKEGNKITVHWDGSYTYEMSDENLCKAMFKLYEEHRKAELKRRKHK